MEAATTTASGSGEDPGRPWTAATTWAPAGGASAADAVSFETSADDAEASPPGVLLRPPSDGDSPPCEVTVSFRKKHEIHRVYVRSTARIYEIYYSTDSQNSSKDYLCTVRCGIAVKEKPLPSAEESIAQCQNSNVGTIEKQEHETKSVSSNSDEDGWVEVKIPESPAAGSQERNGSGTCEKNTLVHYEATAEIADASPCVSLTVRLLSLQSKTSVHVEEIYIFADPVESTDDSVTGPGNMGSSPLLAMFVPSLLQMSKSRNYKVDDRYFSDGLRAQLPQYCTNKESTLCGNMAQAAGLCGINDSKFKSEAMEGAKNLADGDMESNDKSNQDECHARDPKYVPLQKQVTENTEAQLTKDQKVSIPDQLANPLMNEDALAGNRIERMLGALLSKVEKMESYYSRFENMMSPISGIEARLQQLEQQFNSFSVKIQSLQGPCTRTSATEVSCDTTHSQDKASIVGDAGTSAPITSRQPALAVKAPDFSIEDYCGPEMEADENLVTLHEPNMVPKLLVKAPEFICEPEFDCKQLHGGTYSPPQCGLSSAKERKTGPGLAVKVPEFDNDEDDEEVEEEKDAEVVLDVHDDDHIKSDDTLNASAVDSSKCKTPVTIESALASALEAFLASTKVTSFPKSVSSTICNSSHGNTNDSSTSSVPPEQVDGISIKPDSFGQFPSTFGEAEKVGASPLYQEDDTISDTSLTESNSDDKGFDDLDAQSNGLSSDPAVYISSNKPSEEPSQPPKAAESINEGDLVTENEPGLCLAEFLAERNVSSCNNSTTDRYCGSADAGIPTPERTSMEGGKNFNEESQNSIGRRNNLNQLRLLKQALEGDEEKSKFFDNVPMKKNFEGSSYAAPDNGPYKHSTNAIEAVSDDDEGLKSTANNIFLSDEMDSVFCHPSFVDVNKRWIGDSSLDSSVNGRFMKHKVQLSWSDVSSTESLERAPSGEAVISGTRATSTGSSADHGPIPDIGVSCMGTPTAGPREELQNVFDLLYEYKDDILAMELTTERGSKNSPSLEVLLGEYANLETQVSAAGIDGNDVGFASAKLFGTFSSPEDIISSMREPLVNAVDLPVPSETCAYAVNEPLVDAVDLPVPSEAHASAKNEPLVDAVDQPCASSVDEPLIDAIDLPKPSEPFAGGRNGEYPDSLI